MIPLKKNKSFMNSLFDFISSKEHKRQYFEENIFFFLFCTTDFNCMDKTPETFLKISSSQGE